MYIMYVHVYVHVHVHLHEHYSYTYTCIWYIRAFDVYKTSGNKGKSIQQPIQIQYPLIKINYKIKAATSNNQHTKTPALQHQQLNEILLLKTMLLYMYVQAR